MSTKKRRLLRTVEKHYCPHNDLMNIAHHFMETVDQKLAATDPLQRKGVALDQLAVLTFLAFAVEAQINFMGERFVKGWNERWSYGQKAS